MGGRGVWNLILSTKVEYESLKYQYREMWIQQYYFEKIPVVVFQLVRLAPVVLLYDQVRLHFLNQFSSQQKRANSNAVLLHQLTQSRRSTRDSRLFEDTLRDDRVGEIAIIFFGTYLAAMQGTHSLQRGVAAAPLLLLFSLATSGVCQNIDTATPILREPSASLNANAYFGYSLVLHQTDANPSNMGEALAGAR